MSFTEQNDAEFDTRMEGILHVSHIKAKICRLLVPYQALLYYTYIIISGTAKALHKAQMES